MSLRWVLSESKIVLEESEIVLAESEMSNIMVWDVYSLRAKDKLICLTEHTAQAHADMTAAEQAGNRLNMQPKLKWLVDYIRYVD